MRLQTPWCSILLPISIAAWQTTIVLPVIDRNVDFGTIFAQLVASEYTSLAHDQHDDSAAINDGNRRLEASIAALQASVTATEETRTGREVNANIILHLKCTQQSDIGWICQQLYANRERVEDVLDLQPLRTFIAEYLNARPPDPGQMPPPVEDTAMMSRLSDLLGCKESLNALRDNGFVLLDDAMLSSSSSAPVRWPQQLQDTGQGDHIRTDQVYFLNRNNAEECGWAEHFDLLMACATILNERLKFPFSPYESLLPATRGRPLTVPKEIQYAEYRNGDFYKLHSDNSLTEEMASDGNYIRSNFRAYTCILYMNDQGWDLDSDGGALRLFPTTQFLMNVDDAANMEHVDVAPIQGRLLVFDSCLVHSVQTVTSPNKVRRALTLWINKPNDSGVKGEVYF